MQHHHSYSCCPPTQQHHQHPRGATAAVHSGTETSCQACLDATMRPRFSTDLPPKLLMSNISCFCLWRALSLSRCFHICSLYLTRSLHCRSDFTHCCYGNKIFGTSSIMKQEMVLDACATTVSPPQQRWPLYLHFLPLYNTEAKTSCRSGDVLMGIGGGNSAALSSADE